MYAIRSYYGQGQPAGGRADDRDVPSAAQRREGGRGQPDRTRALHDDGVPHRKPAALDGGKAREHAAPAADDVIGRKPVRQPHDAHARLEVDSYNFV